MEYCGNCKWLLAVWDYNLLLNGKCTKHNISLVFCIDNRNCFVFEKYANCEGADFDETEEDN